MQDDIQWLYWIGKDYWSNRQSVEPWQACALSVGIEPKSMTADFKDYSVGPGVSVVWGPQPTQLKQITLREFERRLSLLRQDKDDPQFFKVKNDGKIFLHQFVAWMKATDICDFPWRLAELDARPVEIAEWNDSRVFLDESEKNAERHQLSRFAYEHNPPVQKQTEQPHLGISQRSPENVRAQFAQVQKQRRDLLDPKIDEVKRVAGSNDAAAVFAQLREMAIREEGPFNGVDQNGGLLWTPARGKRIRSLTLDALQKRLVRRRSLPPLTAANRR